MPCRSSTEGHALGAETGDAGLLGVLGVFADTRLSVVAALDGAR